MLLSFQKYSSQGTNMQVNECNKKILKQDQGPVYQVFLQMKVKYVSDMEGSTQPKVY